VSNEVFPNFLPLAQELLVFDLNKGFLVKSCIFCLLGMSRIPKCVAKTTKLDVHVFVQYDVCVKWLFKRCSEASKGFEMVLKQAFSFFVKGLLMSWLTEHSSENDPRPLIIKFALYTKNSVTKTRVER